MGNAMKHFWVMGLCAMALMAFRVTPASAFAGMPTVAKAKKEKKDKKKGGEEEEEESFPSLNGQDTSPA